MPSSRPPVPAPQTFERFHTQQDSHNARSPVRKRLRCLQKTEEEGKQLRRACKSDDLANRHKCDLAKPSCARCTRLCIPCVGAGQQRYKFKDQSPRVKRLNSDSSTEQQTSGSATPETASSSTGRALSRSPSNETSALAAALVQAVKPETSWRFNMAYTYGGFIALIPQRLGRNAALDASVAALTEAHLDFCNHQPASRSVLSKYSRALTKLRMCLDDPQIATQSDTLCAVMLLLITQVSRLRHHTSLVLTGNLAEFHRNRRYPPYVKPRCWHGETSEGSRYPARSR